MVATATVLNSSTVGSFRSMDAVVRANQRAGQSWFSPDTLRFFSSRVSDIIYGGAFFVTSERSGWDAPRAYTVRVAMADGTIETVGEFQGFVTRDDAHRFAAGYASTVAGGHAIDLDAEHTEDCPECEEDGPEDEDIDAAHAQYLETALWSAGEDEEGRQLDDRFSEPDYSDDARDASLSDVSDFIHSNWNDVQEYVEILVGRGQGRRSAFGQVGHDFSLTRQGHGVGFWDRGLGELGDRLTKASKVYGDPYLTAGDDGLLHFN